MAQIMKVGRPAALVRLWDGTGGDNRLWAGKSCVIGRGKGTLMDKRGDPCAVGDKKETVAKGRAEA